MRPDNEIALSVANHLKRDVAVDAEKIKITVEHGVVTLEGNLEWDFQRQAAEAIRCFPDVVRLDNLISVNKANARAWRDRRS